MILTALGSDKLKRVWTPVKAKDGTPGLLKVWNSNLMSSDAGCAQCRVHRAGRVMQYLSWGSWLSSWSLAVQVILEHLLLKILKGVKY